MICHILTGHSYIKTGQKGGIQGLKDATNAKTNDFANTLFDFIFSGAFDRHPKLRLLLAESEIGWLPFLLQQWDYYFERFRKDRDRCRSSASRARSSTSTSTARSWRTTSARASSRGGARRTACGRTTIPHFNMTFPHSRNVVEYHLKGPSAEKRKQLTWDNAIQLFKLDLKRPNAWNL